MGLFRKFQASVTHLWIMWVKPKTAEFTGQCGNGDPEGQSNILSHMVNDGNHMLTWLGYVYIYIYWWDPCHHEKKLYISILMGSMSPYIDHENSIHGSYSNWTSLSEISGGFDQESNEHKPPVFPAMTRMTLDMHGARCTKSSQLWPLTDIHGIRWD